VDDELANVRFLEIILMQAGFTNVQSTMASTNAVQMFREFQPDIVLLDLHMPHLDGFGVMAQLKPMIGPHSYMPILVLTADRTPDTMKRALAEGATDFLSKPLDTSEVLLRISNLLRARFQNTVLEAMVDERTKELAHAHFKTIQRLALASEYRDDATGMHTRRVGVISMLIAEGAGMPEWQVKLIEQTSPLHDIGKIAVSDTILLKPGKLTAMEYETMKKHTTVGANILSGSTSMWLQMAETIVLSHHERWDGTGYPMGFSGETIPIFGRIVAIADVFDGLTHVRPYKQAWPVKDAIAEIVSQSGTQFDPDLVTVFLTLPHDKLL
jgi:putative two-component system response regulator